MTFNLIPEPRTLLAQDKPGLSAAAYAGRTAFEIADQLAGEPKGFALRRMPVDECCASHNLGLPQGFDRAEGYCLVVEAGAVTIGADTDAAAYYARQTLAQLLAGGAVPALTIVDWPKLRLRSFNLCYHVVSESLPMLSANIDYALQLVREYGHLKMNAVLIEFESMFPWRKYPQLRNGQCFSEEDIQRLRAACRENHIEIIPLVQGLGHAYTVLRHPEFAHLREVPDTAQQYCACNPAARDFVMELVGEVLDFFPEVRRLHLGGDESRRLGVCPICAAKVREQGMGALYGDHFNALAAAVARRGVRPMIWGDIMEDHPDILERMDRGISIVYWNYDAVDWNRPYVLEQYLDRGFELFIGPASRFSVHCDTFFHYRKSLRNTAMMAEEAQRHQLAGLIQTDWTKIAPTEPAVVGVVNGAAAAWNEAIAQKEFAARFAALYFGVRCEDMDRAFADLAEAGFRRKEVPDNAWAPPYTHYHVETMQDFLDRMDWSGRYFPLVLGHAVSQQESAMNLRLLEQGEQRAKDALSIFNAMEPNITGHHRELLVLRRAAESQSLKCRMGMAFDEAVKLLKYPKPGDSARRQALAAELRALDEEWQRTWQLVWDALLPGNLEGSLRTAMDLKFDPDARRYMAGFADLLEKGRPLQGLFTLKPYEEELPL